MKKIILSDVIKEHQEKDAEFSIHYGKELLINAIAKIVIELKNKLMK